MRALSVGVLSRTFFFLIITLCSATLLAEDVIFDTPPTPATPSFASVPSSSDTGNYTLTWGEVLGETYYQWRESADGTWSVWNTAGQNVTSASITDRASGSYYYEVKACNVDAMPKCSATVTSNTINVSLTVIPTAPVSITISDGSTSDDGTYTVDWTAATNEPTYYEYLESANGTWSSQWVSTDLNLSVQITGNGDGTYAYKVRACNTAGCSSETISSEVVVTIPQTVGGNGWKNTGSNAPNATWYGDTPEVFGDTNVGALEGVGGVSGGSATYSIPIVIPPGRAGMQPSVSLGYSSRSGNGVAGVGWSLSGASSIHRCGKTAALDGNNTSVNYQLDNDRLCIDGKRLVLVAGIYGESGAEYRTEIDDFSKVIQSGGINSASSFAVYKKDGSVSYYGSFSDSRHKAEGRSEILSWAIQRTVDSSVSKNNIIYTYAEFAPGEHLLTEVAYTGRDTLKGNRTVVFNYADRPDTSFTMLAGGKSSVSQRLTNIKTYYAGQLIRDYRLDYGSVSATSTRSILRSVEECAYKNGAAHCLPVTTFDWADIAPAMSASQPMTFLNSFTVDSYDLKEWMHYFDADGDGHKDVIANEKTNPDDPLDKTYNKYIYFMKHDVKEHVEPLDFISSYNQDFKDINFDGYPDFVQIDRQNNQVKYYYFIKNPDTNVRVKHEAIFPAPSTLDYTTAVKFLDINNDGLYDIVNGTNYYLNTSVSTNANLTIQFASPVSFVGEHSSKHTKRNFKDINGDGLPDLLESKTFTDTPGVTNSIKYYFYFASLDSLGNPVYTKVTASDRGIPSDVKNNQNLFADVNGDGLDDYVTAEEISTGVFRWVVRYNKGDGYFDTPYVTGLSEGIHKHHKEGIGDVIQGTFGAVMPVDVDADGDIELVVAKTPTTTVHAWGRGDATSGSSDDDTEWSAENDELQSAVILSGGGIIDVSRFDIRIFNWSLVDLSSNRIIPNYTSGPLPSSYAGGMTFDDKDMDGIQESSYRNVNLICINTNIVGDYCDGGVMAGNDGMPSYIRVTHTSGISDGVFFNAPNLISDDYALASFDLMKEATTGLGVSQKWKYAPISSTGGRSETDIQLYDLPSGDARQIIIGNNNLNLLYYYFTSSMFVVESSQHSDGIGGDNKNQYSYREAIYSREGRGFQGFGTVIVDDLSDGSTSNHIRSVSDFHQTFPRAGKLIETRSCLVSTDDNCSSNPITKNVYTWTVGKSPASQSEPQPAVFNIVPEDDVSNIENTTEDTASISYKSSYRVLPLEQSSYQFSTVSNHGQNLTVNSDSLHNNWISKQYQSYTFDNFGCATNKASGYVEAGGLNHSEASTTTSYTSDLNSWWLCKPLNQSVTTQALANRDVSQYGFADIELSADFTKQVTTTYNSWDVSRKLTSVTTEATMGAGNAAGLQTVITTSYNNDGLPILVATIGDHRTGLDMDSRTVSTTYTNDGYFVATVTNSKNHTTTTNVDPTHGQAISVTDPNGQVSSMTYDAFGRVRSTKAPGTPTQWTTYNWFACNSCTFNAKYSVETTQYGAPNSRSFMDSMNRALMSQTRDFNDNQWATTTTSYNSKGQKTFESIPHFIADTADVSASASTEVRGVKYLGYDALGRLTQKTTPQANDSEMTTTYSYDGFVTNIAVNGEAPLNMSRKYNGLGQLVWTMDADNNYTRYAYDGAGNPITLEDANGNPIHAMYNALGHKEYVDDPNMGKKYFWYNTLGEVEQELDANGNELTYNYDTLGRMTQRWTKMADESQAVSSGYWEYDSTAPDGRLGMLDTERSSDNVNDLLTKKYSYATTTGGKDYLSEVVHNFTEQDGTTSYGINYYWDDNWGRLKGMRYGASNLVLAYDYNELGFITKIKNANGGYVYQEIRDLDAHGNVIDQLRTNGILTEMSNYHDVTGQMTMISTAFSSGASPLHELTYTYDGFSNLYKQIVSTTGGVNSEQYQYDGLQRLTNSYREFYNGATPLSIDYGYDPAGNFTHKSDYSENNTSAYGYNLSKTRTADNGYAGPNAIRSVVLKDGTTATFEYDMNGNLKTGNGRLLTYNEFNKPLTINKGAITSFFSYGADLMRYKQVKEGLANGITEEIYYLDKLLEKKITKINDTESKVEYIHYIGDVAIQTKTIESAQTDWDIRFTHRDRLGSVVTLTDATGTVTEHRSYDAFGKPRKGDFEDVTPSTLAQVALVGFGIDTEPFTTRGFTDHEHLDEHELIHMNGRAYDYNLGRFLSVDPFIQEPGNSQSMNPYSYILNNPLSGTDPSGYLRACDTFVICDGDRGGSGPNPFSEIENPEIKLPRSNGNQTKQGATTESAQSPDSIGSQGSKAKGNNEDGWTLTKEQYKQLEGLAGTGRRTEYYLALYEMTGSDLAIQMAQISSNSGFLGGVAWEANAEIKKDFGDDYPGTIMNFSEMVFLNDFAQIKPNGSGGYSMPNDLGMLEATVGLWESVGLGDVAPPQVRLDNERYGMLGGAAISTFRVPDAMGYVTSASWNETYGDQRGIYMEQFYRDHVNVKKTLTNDGKFMKLEAEKRYQNINVHPTKDIVVYPTFQ